MKNILIILMYIGITIGVLCLIPFLLMICWNFVMPSLFNLPEISFWMALAIVVIASIIFKSGK